MRSKFLNKFCMTVATEAFASCSLTQPIAAVQGTIIHSYENYTNYYVIDYTGMVKDEFRIIGYGKLRSNILHFSPRINYRHWS